jgi:hypothetical protein
MCPFCIATAALIAGSAAGTGGATAMVAGTIFKRKRRKGFPEQDETEEVSRGNHSDGIEASEGDLAQ